MTTRIDDCITNQWLYVNNKKPVNDLYKKSYITKKKSRKKEYRSGGIIINPSFTKILLVLNRESVITGSPKWGLPKGHMKIGESPNECAVREIEEETGLKLMINKTTPYIKINDTLYYIFIVPDTTPTNAKDLFEIIDVKWVKLSDLNIFSCNRGLKKLNTIQGRVLNLAKKCETIIT